jgi:two-component system, NarL family, invasion response regulator UvrY
MKGAEAVAAVDGTERAERSVRVLVVDDQAPFRLAARAVVRRLAGFEAIGEAATGEEAVERAAELRPDLVLMDIKMPGINGIEATRRLLAAVPLAVVFLCSTYPLDDLPADAADCGASAYLNKEELSADRLRRLWDGRGEAGIGLTITRGD